MAEVLEETENSSIGLYHVMAMRISTTHYIADYGRLSYPHGRLWAPVISSKPTRPTAGVVVSCG